MERDRARASPEGFLYKFKPVATAPGERHVEVSLLNLSAVVLCIAEWLLSGSLCSRAGDKRREALKVRSPLAQ